MSMKPIQGESLGSVLRAQLPSKAQFDTVTACIVKYANPGDKCCDKISYIAYRIWNAIKAIFGMSDWQKATAIVKESAIQSIKQISSPRVQLLPEFNKMVESEADKFAFELLRKALDVPPSLFDSCVLPTELGLSGIAIKIQQRVTQNSNLGDSQRSKSASGQNQGSSTTVLLEEKSQTELLNQRSLTVRPVGEKSEPAPLQNQGPSTAVLPGEKSKAAPQNQNSLTAAHAGQKSGSLNQPPIQDTTIQVLDATPEFAYYAIAKGTRYGGKTGISLSGMSLRPANLFFHALGAQTTMPGEGHLFQFYAPDQVRNSIMTTPPNTILVLSAEGVPGKAIIDNKDINISNLGDVYGKNTYRISYKEIQDTLNSQKIYCSSMLPKTFYQAFKQASLKDQIVTLPDQEHASIFQPPVKMKDINTPNCRALINDLRNNPFNYGFTDSDHLKQFLDLSLYQIGSMVVKTEDYRIFVDGNGQILERNPGEPDAVRLINACGIRRIRETPGLMNSKIMEETFKTAIDAAETGIMLFPAVGMGVWRGDPLIYWHAFINAVAYSADALDKIFVNPRHQPSIEGNYNGRNGDEFAEILNQHIAFHSRVGNDHAVANLNKIVNLYDRKTDLLQLAHNLKKANPDKVVSIFNASDPDVTIGNHVTEYMNNRPHGAPTTEEHYSMMGTNGLCFESITGIHQDQSRIIQAVPLQRRSPFPVLL